MGNRTTKTWNNALSSEKHTTSTSLIPRPQTTLARATHANGLNAKGKKRHRDALHGRSTSQPPHLAYAAQARTCFGWVNWGSCPRGDGCPYTVFHTPNNTFTKARLKGKGKGTERKERVKEKAKGKAKAKANTKDEGKS